MKIRGKAVANTVLFACWNLNVIARSGEIANNLWRLSPIGRGPKTASDEHHGDGLWLVVRDGEESLGRVAVDELDPEDLGGREGSRYLHG